MSGETEVCIDLCNTTYSEAHDEAAPAVEKRGGGIDVEQLVLHAELLLDVSLAHVRLSLLNPCSLGLCGDRGCLSNADDRLAGKLAVVGPPDDCHVERT